jgi:hypothetical protein
VAEGSVCKWCFRAIDVDRHGWFHRHDGRDRCQDPLRFKRRVEPLRPVALVPDAPEQDVGLEPYAT